jgi:hypothetical protein
MKDMTTVLPAGPEDLLTTSARLATVVALLDDGTPVVETGSAGQVAAARLAVRTTRERLEAAITNRQPAVDLFEHGDPAKPLIIGFVEPAPITERRDDSPEHADPERTGAGAPVLEADVDGKRVRVTAQDEIVLQCGSASITLRRNGRVVVRGTYVETHSDGTNRIKGGQVQIN